MTSGELAARLDAINRRLALAKRAGRWVDVAALQAERQAVADELDAVIQSETAQEVAE